MSRRFLPQWVDSITIDLQLLAVVWGGLFLSVLILVPFAIYDTANPRSALIVLGLAAYIGSAFTLGCLRIDEPKR